MAYSTVPTVSAGSPGWSASWVNKYVKDNFAAGVPDIFTTKGDLAVATAADTATRLAVGVDGAVLWADSTTTTGLVWGGAGLAKVNDADQGAIFNYDTWTQVINLDAEFYDLWQVWASDTFTAPHDGYYLVTAMMQIVPIGGDDFDTNDFFQVAIYKNNSIYSVIAGNVWQAAGTASIIMSANGADIVYLARTNTIKFYVMLDSTDDIFYLNPNSEDVSHHISITWLA